MTYFELWQVVNYDLFWTMTSCELWPILNFDKLWTRVWTWQNYINIILFLNKQKHKTEYKIIYVQQ